jgi:hypothetical protein
MTTLADATQTANVPNRMELERALLMALAQGEKAIPAQVRAMLTLSRFVQPVEPNSFAEPTLSVEYVRLLMLADMAEMLTEKQFAALLRDVQRVTDSAVRLKIIARVALRVPAQHFHATVLNLYQQATKLSNPADCARLMFQITPLLMLLHDEPSAPPALLDIVALAQAISSPEARIRSLITLSPHLPQNMRVRVLHRALDEIDRLNSDIHRCNALHTLAEHLIPELEERALHSAELIKAPAERARALTALARYLPLEVQSTLRVDALNAISTIIDEEERADALIAFAPHLEYVTDTAQFPALLEHALGIAISMTRRAMRARVLVALAPHLTLDLQGEALAAVHTLSNERERAMLLAELAPTLPQDMLVASLAVAHSMQAQDARVHALTVLAHHVPDNARDQTILDALAAASNLPQPFERVTALVALIEILPEPLKEQTYANALESARLMSNDNARARAIGLIGIHLPPRLMHRALEIARGIENNDQRLSALMNLAPYLVDVDMRKRVVGELLKITRDIPFEYKQARTVADLAPQLPPDLIPEALNIARSIEEPFDRASAYLALVKRFSGDAQREIIAECWRLIKGIDNGYDAASALSNLAPLLPPSAAHDLAQTAGMVIGSIMDDYDQASAITILAPLLANPAANPTPVPPTRDVALEMGLRAALSVRQPSLRAEILAEGAELWADVTDDERCFQLWREVLLRLAHLPLAEALLCLSALQPVIRKMGGSTALNSIAQMLEMR